VEEYDSLAPGMSNELTFTLPEMISTAPVFVGVWCDILKLTSATVIARYHHDYYAGKPAITLNRFGQGQVAYIGTFGDAHFYKILSTWLISLAGVRPLLHVPPDIEVTERWQGNQRLLFVLNHSGQQQEITLDGSYRDMLSNLPLKGAIAIAPRDVFILIKAEG
jgi:beta-galactosidase